MNNKMLAPLALLLGCMFHQIALCQNVGIGTATPTDGRLQVQHAGNSTLGFFTDGTTGLSLVSELGRPAVGFNMLYSGGNYAFKGNGYGGLLYYVPQSGSLTYYSSDVSGVPGAVVTFSPVISMKADGKVGIGISTPDKALLQVVSASNQSMFSVSPGTNLPGLSLSAPLGLSATLSFNMYYANAYRYLASGYGANFSFNPASGVLAYATSQTSGDPGSTAFFNSSNFNLDSNGYLGLGTSVPKARLHATSAVIGPSTSLPATGYILSVDGKVICEEVKVQNSTAWPDYVFEEQFPMLPLSELERQVMTQKHLPGMLSASDVENKQGYEIGDMQKRILERVEVLYRYLFLMNKENQALRAELQAVKSVLPKRP